MSRHHRPSWNWLIAVILVHLAVSIVHGAAHAEAHVPLSRAANLFVVVVILVGPLLGLALAMAGRADRRLADRGRDGRFARIRSRESFRLVSPDHVAHVDTQWQPLFAATAVLLAVTKPSARPRHPPGPGK
jgi:hypothetical protein